MSLSATTSDLLSLPAELRKQIYEEVFRRPNSVVRPKYDGWSRQSRFKKTGRIAGNGHPLALAMTCRRMYAECSGLIFEYNTFEFRVDEGPYPRNRKLSVMDFRQILDVLGRRMKQAHVKINDGYRCIVRVGHLRHHDFTSIAEYLRLLTLVGVHVRCTMRLELPMAVMRHQFDVTYAAQIDRTIIMNQISRREYPRRRGFDEELWTAVEKTYEKVAIFIGKLVAECKESAEAYRREETLMYIS